MRTAGRLLISCVGAVVCFVLGLLITVRINLAVYGKQEFERNAGANFAVLMEGLIFGSILSIIGFFVVLRIVTSKKS
jgi:hypothetical protein